MLANKINSHVSDALARLLQEYKNVTPRFLMRLAGTPPYTPTGTFSPFLTVAPTTTIPIGYGALTGIGQAFQVASALSVGQVTASFQVAGALSDGLLTAYLYGDNGQSPSVYAVPAGGPIARSVEVYSVAEIAQDWLDQMSTGYVAKTFTFDVALSPGYYWLVLGTNYPASAGNSLLLGLASTGGLAFANGYYAGQDITGVFGANGATGVDQVALTIARIVSAPPLEASNSIEVTGLGAMIAAQADQFQLLENAIFSLDRGRQLFDGTSYPAVGAQLDGIGALVGQPRNGMTDDLYLVFILGRIGVNFSNGTLPELSTLVSLLFQTNDFLLLPLFPAELDVQIQNTAGLAETLFPEAITLVSKATSGGVGLGFGTIYPPSPFQFTTVGGGSVGGGFGTTAGPGGGGFAGLFFSNPGV